jgi:hypothetical protein
VIDFKRAYYEKKLEENEAVHKLVIDFKRAYDSKMGRK